MDFHLWSIGSGLQAALITVVSSAPQSPDFYRQMIAKQHALAHLTIEVHAYQSRPLFQNSDQQTERPNNLLLVADYVPVCARRFAPA